MKKSVWITGLLLIMLPIGVTAYINPASAYCSRLGYKYETVQNDRGAMSYCVMPDGTKCNQGEFIKGTCGKDFNYCARKGLESKITDRNGACPTTGNSVCVLCIDKEGNAFEAVSAALADTEFGDPASLTDLDTPERLLPTTTLPPREAVCGDNVCEEGEAVSCPSDCNVSEEQGMFFSYIVIGLLVLAAIAIAIFEKYLNK